jgi:hypothetical protein
MFTSRLNSRARLIVAIPLVLLMGCESERLVNSTAPSALQSRTSSKVISPNTEPFNVLASQSATTAPESLDTPSVAPIDTTTDPVIDANGNVSLASGRATFTLPPSFTPMTAEEIALKFPSRGGNQPQYVFANDRRNVAIAITFSSARVTTEQLPELKTVIQSSITRTMPDIQWLTEEMTTINQQPWVHLEFVSRAVDTQIHNDTYFTSLDGKMLGFNFNATAGQYQAVKSELDKARNSIVITH